MHPSYSSNSPSDLIVRDDGIQMVETTEKCLFSLGQGWNFHAISPYIQPVGGSLWWERVDLVGRVGTTRQRGKAMSKRSSSAS